MIRFLTHLNSLKTFLSLKPSFKECRTLHFPQSFSESLYYKHTVRYAVIDNRHTEAEKELLIVADQLKFTLYELNHILINILDSFNNC